MDAPSMVQRSGDTLIVRSVVSGNQLYLNQEADQFDHQPPSNRPQKPQQNAENLSQTSHPPHYHQSTSNHSHYHTGSKHDSAAVAAAFDDKLAAHTASAGRPPIGSGSTSDDADPLTSPAAHNLPQCKIKRNYSCNSCTYFTQNPRHFLTHLKDQHGEKIVINACRQCLYASRHYQKLVRHMKMVHGSTDGLEEQALSRKRASQLAREQKKRKCSPVSQQQQQQQLLLHTQQASPPSVSHHELQMHIQNEYHQQMQQQHQQLLQQQQHNQLLQQRQLHHQLERSPEPDSDQQRMQLLNDAQSIDSCSSSPEPPEPIVTLLDPPMVSLHHNDDAGSPAPSGQASACGDQADNSKQLKCTLCEFSTYWRAQLVDHERVEHKLTQFYRCAKCTYVTHIKARYSKHVKYHSMPMIKCEMCDFRTPYKWNLDRHMKNHGGAGLYKCSACNFTADIKQSLTVHEMNHHVPPVGHASGMSMARRRNKVGGTDIVSDDGGAGGLGDFGVSMSLMADGRVGHGFDADAGQMSSLFSMGLNNNNNNNNQLPFQAPLITNIKLEAPADLSMKKTPFDGGRKSSRPVPNLIPILGQPNFEAASPVPGQTSSLSAEVAAVAAAMNINITNRNMLVSLANAMAHSEDATSELPPNATIQDLAALLLKSAATESAASHRQPEAIINLSHMSPASSTASSSVSPVASASGGLRRKQSANFFEEMKLKLATNAGNVSNLVCPCGHASKCLSERIIHQKQCTYRAPSPHPQHHHGASSGADSDVAGAAGAQTQAPVNLSISAGGSTRCQYCRHRCKSSTDLFVHMQNCLEVRASTSNGESLESGSNCDGSSSVRSYRIDVDKRGDGSEEDAGCGADVDDEDDDENNISDVDDDSEDELCSPHSAMAASAEHAHPMENRVFVWNNLSSGESSRRNKDQQAQPSMATSTPLHHQKQQQQQQHHLDRSDSSELDSKAVRFYGIETAPGYGEVTQKLTAHDMSGTAASTSHAIGGGGSGGCGGGGGDDDIASASLKKVFKCPHCSFWASTASRFHVHIVGHLNKKPFECSLCSYRSNWRWDITKHIRLKTIRDPSHKNARVLMNDETGRRNYTKYNKHITLMKVTEEDGDPKLLKSGEMTPSQEAALSFLGQSSSDSTATNAVATGAHQPPQSLMHQTPPAAGSQRFATSSEDGFDSCDGPLSLVKGSPAGAGSRPLMPALISTGALMASQKPAGGRALAVDGDGKKTSFKCKKCNFRHANRDVVLTHVKGHYRDAGIQLDLKTNNDHNNSASPSSNRFPLVAAASAAATADIAALLPPPEPPVIAATALQRLSLPASVSIHLQPVQPPPVSAPIVNAATAAPTAAPPAEDISSSWSPILLPSPLTVHIGGQSGGGGGGTIAEPNESNYRGNTNNNNNNNLNNNNENGEMDEASSLLGSSSVTGNWRDPAPYRCGHCHQVSNWKHVIQRHCRLKHNGDINIEFIEKGNRTGAYTRLFIPGISSSMPDETPPTEAPAEAAPPPANNAPEQQLTINIGVAAGTSPEATTHESGTKTSSSAAPNQLIQLLNLKSRLYLCKHCFFSSPCRSQLDDHQKSAHPQQPSLDNRPPETDDQPDDDGTVDVDAISAGIQSPSAPGHRINQQLAHIQQMRRDNTFASAHALITEHAAPPVEVNLISDADDNDVQSPPLLSSLPPPPAEKCPHCPFETGQPDRLTEHMQYHRCVSAVQLAGNCAHCDYSVADERTLRRHVRLHFGGGDDDDPVAMSPSSPSPRRRRARRGAAAVRYFTRYEGLVLSSTTARTRGAPLPPAAARRRSDGRCKRRRVQTGAEADQSNDVQDEETDADEIDERREEDIVVIFPVINGGGSASCHGRKSVESVASGGSDKENKIIVDIRTGEVVEA